MATIEGKQETKQEPKTEAKPESKEAEESQEPTLKYKAWVLKVSIHCEGCKRKVEKILRNIDGVYEACADLKKQKATVKANLHVDVDTLIKKLVKKGRHAELWPEKSEQKEKKQKSKNKDKQGGQGQANSEEGNPGGGDKEKETVKNEVSAHQDSGGCCCTAKNVEGCHVSKAHDHGGQVPDHVKQTVTLVVGNQSPVPEKKGCCSGGGGGESEGNAGGSGGGSKKNKKKGQKGNANVNFDEGEGGHPADAGTGCIGSHFSGYGPHGPIPMPTPVNYSPPRQHHMPEYPTYSHAPSVYVTSYNTSYPSSSYSASYYASPPLYSYRYMHSGHTSEHPSFGTYSSYSSQPSNSFEMFSDENPNACLIM